MLKISPRAKKMAAEIGPQKVGESREKSREKILELVMGNPSITAQEFADSVGLSVKGIEKAIRVLKEQGLLKRVGPDKGGHWELAKG